MNPTPDGARHERCDRISRVNRLVAWVAGVVAGTTPPNLFRTLATQPRLFRGWLHFAGCLMPGGTLPRRETELVILRIAHLRGNRYEFEHHARLARRAGVRPADLDRLAAGPAAPGWSEREQLLLTAADRLVTHRDLDEPTRERLGRQLAEPQLVELCLLVGHYDMLATVITALRIEPDSPRRRSPLQLRRSS